MGFTFQVYMGTASQSGNSAQTEIHGYPSSAGYDTSRNSQAPQVTSADQLTNPNQERPVKENQKSNVNHHTPTLLVLIKGLMLLFIKGLNPTSTSTP
jgi:hypothetical protein